MLSSLIALIFVKRRSSSGCRPPAAAASRCFASGISPPPPLRLPLTSDLAFAAGAGAVRRCGIRFVVTNWAEAAGEAQAAMANARGRSAGACRTTCTPACQRPAMVAQWRSVRDCELAACTEYLYQAQWTTVGEGHRVKRRPCAGGGSGCPLLSQPTGCCIKSKRAVGQDSNRSAQRMPQGGMKGTGGDHVFDCLGATAAVRAHSLFAAEAQPSAGLLSSPV